MRAEVIAWLAALVEETLEEKAAHRLKTATVTWAFAVQAEDANHQNKENNLTRDAQ